MIFVLWHEGQNARKPVNTGLLCSLRLFPRHQTDRLHVFRSRKLVKRRYFLDAVAAVAKERQVVNLGGGIAGDVDDAFGLGGKEVLNGFGVNALARGIEEDDVGAFADVGETGQFGQDVGSNAFDIGQVITHAGLFCLLDGFFDNFNTDDTLRMGSGNLGEGACARIEVVDRFSADVAGKFQGLGIEVLSAGDVGLKEGKGPHMEGEIKKFFLQIGAAGQKVERIRLNHIGRAVIGGMKDAHKAHGKRQSAQAGQEGLRIRYRPRMG